MVSSTERAERSVVDKRVSSSRAWEDEKTLGSINDS